MLVPKAAGKVFGSEVLFDGGNQIGVAITRVFSGRAFFKGTFRRWGTAAMAYGLTISSWNPQNGTQL